MKHIVIDARLYGPQHTGIGRYVQNLLVNLPTLPNFNRYRFTLLVYSENLPQIQQELGHNFHYVTTSIRHYSVREQFVLPFIIYGLKPDLFHVPHFNKPILYTGKTIITIHDLIKNFSKGSDTTNQNPLFYWPKYFLYRLLSYVIIRHDSIIVPSNFWRHFIIKHYKINPQKIITTYEAVDKEIVKNTKQKITKNLLYVGNLYPHKNIQIIFEALKSLPQFHLNIISKPSVFLERTKNSVKAMGIESQITFLGFVNDANLGRYYEQAYAYIFPSLMEGFGLPGLEAMAYGCPVVAAKTSCLPEVYGQAALYFDPHNADSLIVAIDSISQQRKQLQELGYHQIAKYSWHQTAALTLAYYEKCLNS